MDGAGRIEVGSFEVPDGFEVLDSDALVVLGSAGEDLASGCAVGRERRVGPFGGLGGDGVKVGVEEEGRESRVGSGPGEEEEGFVGGEVEGPGLEADGLGLGVEVGNGGGVVRVRVGGFDPEVVLEASDGSVWF